MAKANKNDEEFWNTDDFWNTSSTNTFNFDDEDDDCGSTMQGSEPEKGSENLLNPAREENTHMPLGYLISNESLNLIINHTMAISDSVVPPIEETMKKMFFGYSCNLHIYKKLKDKLALLDAAIDIRDGNAIISVILFLRKTLKFNIFYNNLSKRKIAVRHYANYLIFKNQLQELADFYMATSNTALMKDLYYLLCKDCSNLQTAHKKLEQFVMEHATNFNFSSDKFDINEHISFIKWQLDNNERYDSLIGLLAGALIKEFQNKRGDIIKMTELKKQFKIDDFQYEWTIMNILAKLGLWTKLINIFIGSNWLTKKSVLKSVIRPDLFVMGMTKHKPPVVEFEQFLYCVPDTEKVLQCAQKINAHNFIINYYVNQRDRQALLKYRDQNVLSPDQLLIISNALHVNDRKWKN